MFVDSAKRESQQIEVLLFRQKEYFKVDKYREFVYYIVFDLVLLCIWLTKIVLKSFRYLEIYALVL